MECLACEWKRENVKAVSQCPNCGADCIPIKSYPQPVYNPVDNFPESQP